MYTFDARSHWSGKSSSLHSHNTAYLALCLQPTKAKNDVLSDRLHV